MFRSVPTSKYWQLCLSECTWWYTQELGLSNCVAAPAKYNNYISLKHFVLYTVHKMVIISTSDSLYTSAGLRQITDNACGTPLAFKKHCHSLTSYCGPPLESERGGNNLQVSLWIACKVKCGQVYVKQGKMSWVLTIHHFQNEGRTNVSNFVRIHITLLPQDQKKFNFQACLSGKL